MAAVKPTLSREYLYVPFTEMEGIDVDALDVGQLAFMSPATEPLEADWEVAIIAGTGDPLFQADIGEALVILIGPDRGDSVTTLDLPDGDFQVWVDAKPTGSDERVVRVAGTFTNSPTG